MNIYSDSFKLGDLVNGYVNNGDLGCVAKEGHVILRGIGVCERKLQDVDCFVDFVTQFPGSLHVLAYKKSDDCLYVFHGSEYLIELCECIIAGNKDLSTVEVPVVVCSGEPDECLNFMSFISQNQFVHDNSEFVDVVYSSPWRDDAKLRLGQLFNSYREYVDTDDPVDTAVAWAAQREDITKDEYLDEHKDDSDAGELVRYCERVFAWVKEVFTTVREDAMRVQPWGEYYNDYGNKIYKPDKVESIIKALYENPDIRNKSGIYEYFFTGDEDVLNLKKFTKTDIQAVLDKQEGKCSCCGQEIGIKDAKISMVTSVRDGGRVDISNAVVLCKKCEKAKGDR